MSINSMHMGKMNQDTRPDIMGTGPGPNWASVAEGAVAASIVLPFMQALASKAGEDAYQALKDLFSLLRPSREQVTMEDLSSTTRLVYFPPLSDEAIKQLVSIAPARLRGRVATWDEEAGTWFISETARHLHVAEEDPQMMPDPDWWGDVSGGDPC